MRAVRAALVVGLVTLVAACSWAPGHSPNSPTAATKASPSAAAQGRGKVEHPWRAGDFQDGVQVLWHPSGTDAQIQVRADAILNYVVGLGANSIGLNFPLYTDGATPTKVSAGDQTPSPHELSLVIQAAHRRGLRVMVRPALDEASIAAGGGGAWRGTIRPPDVGAWFASYRTALTPYLKAAGQAHAEEFVIGVELYSMERYTDQWALTRKTARTWFDGQVSMAVNWDEVGHSALPVDALGLDLYPALQLPDSASAAQVRDAVTTWLKDHTPSVTQPIVAQEVGIAGSSGAYRHPWYWGSGRADPHYFGIQATWFDAVYQAARDSGLKGVYYWMVDSNQRFSPAAVSAQTAGGFVGRPGEAAIRRSFAR